jgi:hypothetical protein
LLFEPVVVLVESDDAALDLLFCSTLVASKPTITNAITALALFRKA